MEVPSLGSERTLLGCYRVSVGTTELWIVRTCKGEERHENGVVERLNIEKRRSRGKKLQLCQPLCGPWPSSLPPFSRFHTPLGHAIVRKRPRRDVCLCRAGPSTLPNIGETQSNSVTSPPPQENLFRKQRKQ